MVKSTLRALAALLTVLFLWAMPMAWAAATDYPALTGRIVDNAHILNAATQQNLITKLSQL